MSSRTPFGLTRHFKVHLIGDNSIYHVAVKTDNPDYDPAVVFARNCKSASRSPDSEKVLVFDNHSLKKITQSERLKVLLAIASNRAFIKEES